VLSTAQSIGREDFFDRVRRDAFKGLAKTRPVRALAALLQAGRQGFATKSAWSQFLWSDARAQDRPRLVRSIAARLTQLPIDQFQAITYPISQWMLVVATHLYADSPSILEQLWDRMTEALVAGEDGRAPTESLGWADVALNGPVGQLVDLLLRDPSMVGLELAAGLPVSFSKRGERLLGLRSNFRRHALVKFAFRVSWLHAVDPAWTQGQILSAADDAEGDGDAFWSGFLWSARLPNRALYERLKPQLLVRAHQPKLRRHHSNVLAGLLLSGWLGDEEGPEERLVSDVELRETLIHSDDEMRGQFIWHLQQLLAVNGGKWRHLVLPFLRNVWPKQRSVRNAQNSSWLADLAMASGELMPEVVEAILPRLVPVRGPNLQMVLSPDGLLNQPVDRFPRATLDLLWAVLAEDPRQWPYRIEDVLARLAEMEETRGDPRLSELRRRRER
jgi:hypothetical protein